MLSGEGLCRRGMSVSDCGAIPVLGGMSGADGRAAGPRGSKEVLSWEEKADEEEECPSLHFTQW